MITNDQVEQIDRLGGEFFVNSHVFVYWLTKNFKVDHVRQLATAERAGQVIRVLKEMLARRAK